MNSFLDAMLADPRALCLCRHPIAIHQIEGDEHGCQYIGCKCPTYIPFLVEAPPPPATPPPSDNRRQ